MTKNRTLRVSKLFKRELANIFLHDLDFPDKTFVTILDVAVSQNLQQAKVYITITPAERSQEVFSILKRNIFAIQQNLNKRLKMRPTPKISWATGAYASRAQRIEELLDQITKKK
jgi:ribosome-binding factor A